MSGFWFHRGFWTHTLNVQHLYRITFSPAVSQFGGFKQMFPASLRRDIQTKTMPHFQRACSSSADAKQMCVSGIQLTPLHKYESVFMNPTVTSRVKTKWLFFPEEDSLPTLIKPRQLALKPRSESNGAASPLSHTHRWLPSSLLNPLKEERCVFCGSFCDAVVVEINSLLKTGLWLLIWQLCRDLTDLLYWNWFLLLF